MRQIFVISDLHLGGRYPDAEDQGNVRGFRLLTRSHLLKEFLLELGRLEPPVELVINGDFVDFLAECHAEPPEWRPFIADGEQAAAVFLKLAGRDQPIFEALGRFVRAGHRLTVLLGNHDLELSLPAVRQAFEQVLGITAHDYRFILDGEAYVVGDVLIEHGNRYDPVNEVDYGALHEIRATQSRRGRPQAADFAPPAGSRLVSRVINPIKETWPFIDLLKPESEALIAVLLALDPSLRRHIPAAIGAFLPTPSPWRGGLPSYGESISAATGERSGPTAGPRIETAEAPSLESILRPSLGEETESFLAALETDQEHSAGRVRGLPSAGEDVSRGSFLARLSVLRQIINGRSAGWETRIYLLRQALRALEGDESFRRDVEEARYLGAAQELARRSLSGKRPLRAVIFGHTHKPKEVPLGDGAAVYLNPGSWADQMRFPKALREGSDDEAREALEAFLEDLETGRLGRHIVFEPLFVDIRLSPSGLSEIDLRHYVPGVLGAPPAAAEEP